ncbi:MAG: VWA domain-containing protein [Gemmatimonadaceae bacterium]|nr:VWA domain-containing protein [Gemmatimonadaceae bacterium]
MSRRTPFRRSLLVALAAAAAVLAPRPAAAQGWIEARPQPGPIRPRDWNVTRVSTAIRATIEGRVARIEVEEQFRNNGGGMAEGTYHYPLAGEAVFQSLSLWMGETEMRGELMDASRAKGIYEEIVRRRRDPALITLAGHQLLRAQVFPIQPGETRKVVLRFTQLLDKEGDALRWRYALGPEERGSVRPDIRVTLREPARFGRPFSPTHTVAVSGENDRDVRITDGARGDIELFLPLQSTAAGLSVVTHAPAGEQGYFLLYVTPPEMAAQQAIGRDLTLVVDVSGSMSGPKLEQAKAAIHQVLGTLGTRDRFRLVAFSSAVRPFRDGFVTADAQALEAARNWTNSLVADGGTNIEGALREAMRRQGGSTRDGNLDVLVFLTDGVPSVGETQPERLAALASQESARMRIFTIGIGTDVNTYLLERMAQDGRGSAGFVPPEGSVEETVGSLARKLRAPALVDLRVVSSPARIVSMEPVRLPDLFAGQELVVLGRYEGSGSGPLVIEGMRDGEKVRVSTPVTFAQSDTDHEYVGTLWAARRIGALTRTMRLEGSTPARIEEIKSLALRHGIVTEYTAYLVQEPVVASGGPGMPRRTDRDGRATNVANAPMASAPAVAQTGRAAFEQAQTSADMAGAGSVGEARKASERAQARLEPEARVAGGGTRQRIVGSRRFEQQGSQWTDMTQRSQRVVNVEAFSPAYFALLRLLPELRDASQLGDDVLVAGQRVSIRLQRTGQATLAAAEVSQLAKDFRGA